MTDSVVKPGETESTLIYQRLSMEPLESQVSTDACPHTPVPSVQYGENTTGICPTNPGKVLHLRSFAVFHKAMVTRLAVTIGSHISHNR